MKEAEVIRLEKVSKKLNGNPVLQDIDLDVHRGEVVCVVGPSGAGKTTLLKCIDFLEIIDSGRVFIEGKLVVDKTGTRSSNNLKLDRFIDYRKKIGMVFQNFNLWPHKTVLQNVVEGLHAVKKLPWAEAERQALKALYKVNMLDRKQRYPESLSTGEIQRVAIARALAMEPKILLLDEITSALDPELTAEVVDILRSLARDGQTMMVVTHEMNFAKEVAHQIVFLDKGRIIEKASPEEFFSHPREERLRVFLQKLFINTLR